MLKYFLKRCASIVPVLVVVSVLACGFVRLLPGDPARMMAGPDADRGDHPDAARAARLDRSLPVQYVAYMGNVLRGDLGLSLKTKLPVFQEISLRYLPTMFLAVAGWPGRFCSASSSGRWPPSTTANGRTTPHAEYRCPASPCPSSGWGCWRSSFSRCTGWAPVAGFTGKWSELVLPSFTLGATVAAIMARFTLSAFLDVLNEEYISTARAKGVPERRVMWSTPSATR